MTVMLLLSAAMAQQVPVTSQDFVEPLDEGSVNWTTLEVVVERTAYGSGTGVGRKAIEQRGIDKVSAAISEIAPQVALMPGTTMGSLLEDPALAAPIRSRLSRWDVAETTYYASGKIEVKGALALQQVLKPWTLREAVPHVPREREPVHTGLIVDARGAGATPCFVPILEGAQGTLLWEVRGWTDTSLEVAPAIYVSDPAHPAAVRAGNNPFIAVAQSATQCRIALSAEDTLRFRTAMAGARILGEGTVVFVLDPVE